MKDRKLEREKIIKKYEVANDIRKFEIELFWKRSLFFWGFIASVFAGYAYFYDKGPVISTVIANFGLVCSLCWTLANRGSKYWQENWEILVSKIEDQVTGPLYKINNPRLKKGFLGAYRYSVSKLAIALSDYVILIWIFIVVTQIVSNREIEVLLITVFTVVYLIFILIKGKTNIKKGGWKK